MTFISTLLALLVATNSHFTNDSTTRLFHKSTLQDQSQTAGFPKGREILIRELQNLEIAFNNKNKIAISKYLKFPLADSTHSFSYLDTGLDNERKANGDQITKEMFQKHFAHIYDLLQMEQFSKLFRYVNVTDLSKKNHLHHNVHHKDAGCYHIYEIEVKGTEVTLFYGTNTDEAYLNKHPDEEMACAEYSFIWTFIFDGQKLYFKNLIEAE